MAELIWDGKYRETARGREKAGPVRIALPFQTIETVNESAQDRQRSLELFNTGRETQWRNRLIWGDKKYVLPSLLPEFAGKVKLIYIDPPFDTGADFSFTATIPENPETVEEEPVPFIKEASILEQKAYRDTWGAGLDSYLQWFYESVVQLRELLAEDGSIYVHLDWHVGHYAKTLLDDVFGQSNFLNEVVWYYYNKFQGNVNHFACNHDVIFWYRKGERFTFCQQREEREQVTRQIKRTWDKAKGRIVNVKDAAGKVIYQDSTHRTIDDVWRISMLQPADRSQNVGFQTQKPGALLERIIKTSSNDTDLVLDCFVGSGTTAVVAEKLNRRWIACDLSRFAIHTARKRLLSIPDVKPFAVQNLGKYERQAWQVAEFPANGKDHLEEQRERECAYRRFVLDLYHATPVAGYAWLHGLKAGRMVHVGAVDAPVTAADVKAIAAEVWKAAGSKQDASSEIVAASAPVRASVDILGWEFALELNELAIQIAAESRVHVAFKKIPREVLDKKAVEQGDVQFFELGALAVDVKQKAREVRLKLRDFVIPLDDVPEEARKAIKHWSQMIDYWAVDWDYKSDTFHNQWQSYRTRKEPNRLELEAAHTYLEPGQYLVVVKVIDLLGNDTTKTMEIAVH